MDIRLREIAGKAAGTYFMVTDNSGVTEIEETSNLRLFFINVENGPVNTIVVFKKGDTSGFQSIFGKRLRKKEKQGNFSIKSCLNALTAGPIAVMNLRVFNELDTTQIHGLNPNMSLEEKQTEEYSKLFNTNGAQRHVLLLGVLRYHAGIADQIAGNGDQHVVAANGESENQQQRNAADPKRY